MSTQDSGESSVICLQLNEHEIYFCISLPCSRNLFRVLIRHGCLRVSYFSVSYELSLPL
jgi:hypothetical protein